MKRLFTALSIVLILFLSQPVNAQVGVIESDPFDIVIPNAITSTVSITIVEHNGGLATCSGVVIKNTSIESIVLTAKHCLVFEGDMYVESLKVNSVGISYKNDLAYLMLNKFIPYKTPVRISNYIPINNDRIVGVGYPRMKIFTAQGTIFVQTPKQQYAFIDIKKGCSGGGTFNIDGELMGIMIKYYPGVRLAVLVRLEDIHTLINVNKLLE